MGDVKATSHMRKVSYIVPSVFNHAVVPAVSDAVEAAARVDASASVP